MLIGRVVMLGLLLGSSSVWCAPVVTGSLISWPNDGWYQVLTKADYSEVCRGGSSCDVAAGDYIVINHTSGERFENVKVESTTSSNGVTVVGNTISWPDDGWYQVQNAGDYQTVCSGGRSCEVSSGSYVVINHSTGQRFANIKIESTATDSSVTVVGNTISWPDDGWYQVQNESDLQSVCSGGRSCEVVSGSYIVINHTTGQRFVNINVDSAKVNAVSVVGNTIIWPDDGWYQVQNESNYQTVCNGGVSCVVGAGSYLVINHTLGRRYSGIKVLSGESGLSDSHIIRDHGYRAILSKSDYLVRGDWLNDLFDWSSSWLSAREDGGRYVVPLVTSLGNEYVGDGARFKCPVSGDLAIVTVGVDWSNASWYTNYSNYFKFNGCSTGDVVLNGFLWHQNEWRINGSTRDIISNLQFYGFQVSSNDGNSTVDIEEGRASRIRHNYASLNANCGTSYDKQFSYLVRDVSLSENSIFDDISEASYQELTVAALSDGEPSCRYEQLLASGEASAQTSFARNSDTTISTNINVRRQIIGDTTTDSGTGDTTVLVSNGEKLSAALISATQQTAQIEINSGGSATSEVETYDFFSEPDWVVAGTD